MEESRGICGVRQSCRDDEVCRERVADLLHDGRTRSVEKSIPTGTAGTSGACQKNLRADDQVWRILGEFAVFGKVVGMIKYGASRWDIPSTTEGCGASGRAFPGRPWDRAARCSEICAQMIKYGGSSGICGIRKSGRHGQVWHEEG